MRNTLFCTLACFLATPAAAQEPSLSDAFTEATILPAHGKTKISYDVDDCEFQKVVTNVGYCAARDQGEGDRVIRTSIDLSEVERLEVDEVDGDMMFAFWLDYDAPGTWFFLKTFGRQNKFERFVAENGAALEAAEFRSFRSFSTCTGGQNHEANTQSIRLFTSREPENWRSLIERVADCRDGQTFEFEDNRKAGISDN
ncbi:hypothetical protein R3X27_19325 [Tropicimonas sp. TH_r6]|uniref:hypothetical protein n=1 Tax=Tropicimonas sp. TH_r6 TaxID=3082085 RepID=UPI00295369BC|nr:hypothetical protein [Tropicimonas sp. TH_r6]MDV7144838.1 hypothetical protein [Tropicimonas sp. TH_r6]